MKIKASLSIGGFEWDVTFFESLAIIHRPPSFPSELPVPWEENNTIQVPLSTPPPRPLFWFAIRRWLCAVEEMHKEMVSFYIRKEVLPHWRRQVLWEKRRKSRAKAPQRRRNCNKIRKI